MEGDCYLNVDRKALAKDLELVKEKVGPPTAEDFKHLKKVERWGFWMGAIGYATAWITPLSPLSGLLLGFANFSQWANVTHPVLHKGYDRVPNIPQKYHSKAHARGWRRWIHWMDWIRPESWDVEHNEMHHYRLGEKEDPGNMKLNMEWLRNSHLPIWMRYFIVIAFSFIWKLAYFSPSAETAFAEKERLKRGGDPNKPLLHMHAWNPLNSAGRRLWFGGFLPYLLYRFVFIPGLFLPLGWEAFRNVVLASVVAELVANFQSFLMIVPNHAGDDIYLFDGPANSKGEFYLRQILGSVNFTTGEDATDFYHGWLNYQIEHHLYPNVPLSHYRKMRPLVMEVCKKHGIPYKQQNVFVRMRAALKEMVSESQMRIAKPISPIRILES